LSLSRNVGDYCVMSDVVFKILKEFSLKLGSVFDLGVLKKMAY